MTREYTLSVGAHGQIPFESETEEKSSQRLLLSFCCCTFCVVTNFTEVYFFNGEGFSYSVELSPSLLHHLGSVCGHLFHSFTVAITMVHATLCTKKTELKQNQINDLLASLLHGISLLFPQNRLPSFLKLLCLSRNGLMDLKQEGLKGMPRPSALHLPKGVMTFISLHFSFHRFLLSKVPNRQFVFSPLKNNRRWVSGTKLWFESCFKLKTQQEGVLM